MVPLACEPARQFWLGELACPGILTRECEDINAHGDSCFVAELLSADEGECKKGKGNAVEDRRPTARAIPIHVLRWEKDASIPAEGLHVLLAEGIRSD